MIPKTADLCDACDSVRVCTLPWITLGRHRAFRGDICTFRFQSGFSKVRDILQEAGSGRVLVIDGNGLSTGGALFGDRFAELAVNNRWSGIVVNGLVRDAAEIATMDIGLKALGTCPAKANFDGHGDRDVGVSFGGIEFVPGCRLVADDDGLIVFPSGLTEDSVDLEEYKAAAASYYGPRSR